MKIIIYFVSILLSVSGFYLDRIESYPAMLRVVDKEHYYVMQALNNFYNKPKFVLNSDDPALSILLSHYQWPDFSSETKVYNIGRSGMMQIMGDTSIGNDFLLVINKDEHALQQGLSYTKIREREQEMFDKKFGNWGQWIFWFGVLLGIADYSFDKIVKKLRRLKKYFK